MDMPLDIAFADDVDFVSHSHAFLNQVERTVLTCLIHCSWALLSTRVRQRGPPWEETQTEWQRYGGWPKALIPTGRWSCGSQKTAGFGGILLDVDIVFGTPTCKWSTAPPALQCFFNVYTCHHLQHRHLGSNTCILQSNIPLHLGALPFHFPLATQVSLLYPISL